MALTLTKLTTLFPHAKHAEVFLPHLNSVMAEYLIDTRYRRMAAFLAQIGHESCEFQYLEEIASGEAYEGRFDLGNIHVGDGVKYKGRGLLQITGRRNYALCAEALGIPCVETPELLEEPGHATRSAAWFWSTIDGNTLADKGDFLSITRRINGGTRGFANRVAYYKKALDLL